MTTKIQGPMLADNLERYTDLSINNQTLYVDVANSRVGINTTVPEYSLDARGDSRVSDFIISSNRISIDIDNIDIVIDPRSAEFSPGPGGNVLIDANTSLGLPVGNEAERPQWPVPGMLRFNSESNLLEYFDNVSWKTIGQIALVRIYQAFNTVAGQATYTVADPTVTSLAYEDLIVTINGVVQTPNISYQMTGQDITFLEAPNSDDDYVEIRGFGLRND